MQHTLTQRSHTRYLYHLNNFVSTATAAVATTVAQEGKKKSSLVNEKKCVEKNYWQRSENKIWTTELEKVQSNSVKQ